MTNGRSYAESETLRKAMLHLLGDSEGNITPYLLNEYGDELIGAFGLYSSATIGMMNAAQAAGSDVPITSIDNDKVILEGIYEGKLLGSCCYSSTAPIKWCLSQLVNKLNGAEIPNVMFYANTLVTKENVEEMFEFYYNGKTLADYMAGVVD